MDTPDVEAITTWSKVPFDSLDQPFSDDDLEVALARSIGYIQFVTGRMLDDSMPAEFEALAQQATQMRVEQLAYQAQPDYTETGTDDQVANFSAGNYSETRRSPGDRAKAEPGRIPPINSWPALNELLWMLCTPDKQNYWQEQFAEGIPAFEVTEMDWQDYIAMPGGNSGAFFGQDPYSNRGGW